MTPEEKAYEETLRRIRKAEEAGAVELDLGDLNIESTFARVGTPYPLQSLYLMGGQLSDVPRSAVDPLAVSPVLALSARPSYRRRHRCAGVRRTV